MTNQLPIQQEDRTIIVDVLRGFALFGVLQGNFSGMLTNNVPQAVIDSGASSFDQLLNRLHDMFIENKFMTLFSILFGYGFGVIMQRLENKNIDATPFFLRRMFWLFVFGLLNLAFWNGDILHLYALTGIFLLLFRKQSDRFVLTSSVIFLFIVPIAIRFAQHYVLKYSINGDEIVERYYQAYKFGSLPGVAATNFKTYLPQWVYTWVEWRDMSETLGRFLLGYFILRRQFLTRLHEHRAVVAATWRWTLVITIAYLVLAWLSDEKIITTPRYVLFPFLKVGILATTLFYATSIIRLYTSSADAWLMRAFRALGRMTLTNYLMQTILYVIIFYGVGFGLLGDFSFTVIWAAAFVVYFLQAWFSQWWLSRFNYGPMEWIWRQLTYQKRFKLVKNV